MNFVSMVSSSSSSAARTCAAKGPDKTIAIEKTATHDISARRQLRGACIGLSGKAVIQISQNLLPPRGWNAVGPDPELPADQGAFAASPPRRVSYNKPATPATMATSARLKTYQLKLNDAVVRCRSAKSTTAPCTKRSIALPTAPPMIRPRHTANQPAFGPGKPGPQEYRSDQLETQQDPLAERGILREQAVTDALVPDQHQVEKRQHRHAPARAEIEAVEQPQLAGLIEQRDDQRRAQAVAGERTVEVGFELHCRGALGAPSPLEGEGGRSEPGEDRPGEGLFFDKQEARSPLTRLASSMLATLSPSKSDVSDFDRIIGVRTRLPPSSDGRGNQAALRASVRGDDPENFAIPPPCAARPIRAKPARRAA